MVPLNEPLEEDMLARIWAELRTMRSEMGELRQELSAVPPALQELRLEVASMRSVEPSKEQPQNI